MEGGPRVLWTGYLICWSQRSSLLSPAPPLWDVAASVTCASSAGRAFLMQGSGKYFPLGCNRIPPRTPGVWTTSDLGKTWGAARASPATIQFTAGTSVVSGSGRLWMFSMNENTWVAFAEGSLTVSCFLWSEGLSCGPLRTGGSGFGQMHSRHFLHGWGTLFEQWERGCWPSMAARKPPPKQVGSEFPLFLLMSGYSSGQ